MDICNPKASQEWKQIRSKPQIYERLNDTYKHQLEK